MTTPLRAPSFPEQAVRARARDGAAAVFPPRDAYGHVLFGAEPDGRNGDGDALDTMRLVPPVFVPERLEKLVDLGREPLHSDVDLRTGIGGFTSQLPCYISAFGSTQVASAGLGTAVARQAGRLGVPLVIGENIAPMNGYGRIEDTAGRGLLDRIRAYADAVAPGTGGVVVQQSTEDADAEVWNLVYSDPGTLALLESGRLGFELKVGQGAKPGLGGITVVDRERAADLDGQFTVEPVYGAEAGDRLRFATPGTFTSEILRQQIRLMRNNFPRARVWVKLIPGRDVADAARVAWEAGADAVTVDGAEGGTGWAPTAALDGLGLPLGDCLRRIAEPAGCLLASGRMWEGLRAVKCLALGARAVGFGRAALLAADEDPEQGLERLMEAFALESRLLISALGKYGTSALSPEDVWDPAPLDDLSTPFLNRSVSSHWRGETEAVKGEGVGGGRGRS
ncbi:glutamate synthase-related protein [Streptomyces sp. NPDC008150]|uniref:glutamate synthase-related protein n=1 Tax=Streptomyces sp. NPDC008150 TaxID=3364816 RepID=UPI0036EE6AE2